MWQIIISQNGYRESGFHSHVLLQCESVLLFKGEMPELLWVTLVITPLNMGRTWICSDQENMEKVMLYQS